MQDNSSSNPTATPNPVGVPPVGPAPNPGAVTPTFYGEIPSGSVVEPASSGAPAFAPAAPGTIPVSKTATPLTSPGSGLPDKSHRSNVIETIILVVVSLIAITFIGLFIWKYLEWDGVKTDVEGQIDAAIALAVSENTTKLEDEFIEREKYPYKTFAGPADYGSLSFEYPKTWNLYIAKDAAKSSGDYEAYFNPGEVLPVGTSTINALRVTIQNKAFDTVAKSLEGSVKSGKVSMVTRNVGGTVANVYSGELSSNIRGIMTIFKLRDKTVTIQTDAELFADEYYKLLDTVTFVE